MVKHGVTWLPKSLAISAVFGLIACGQKPSTDTSDPEWIQSRGNTTRYAYLTPADLEDDFILGITVTKVDDFLSNALNMVVRPTKVKLAIRADDDQVKLDVNSADGTLLSFDVASKRNRTEVDFASAGNDLQLRQLIDVVGGIFTVGDRNGIWISAGAPSVLNISQDEDTVVVDLEHTVRQAILTTDIFGRRRIGQFLSDHAGHVTLRLFLKRQKSLPRIGGTRDVADGKARSIGFFGPYIGGDGADVKIQRLALGDAQDRQTSVTFHLKDFPAAFEGVATQAILSWNKAFGENVIKVARATADMDVGDPRLNVVKWFNGLDQGVVWAGVAKMLVEPESGLVMGGHVYINGDSILNQYKDIHSFSREIVGGGPAGGQIGQAVFDQDQGEQPVIPFLSDLSQDYDSYMKNYYLETIAHEVGHVLGLRHNFRGSVALEDGESASVMDYAPRSDRAHYKGPGSYDIAALRWGYFGEEPTTALRFCSDEDLWTYFDCSQGDWGQPVEYAIKGLSDGTTLLTKSPVAITADVFISSMGGVVENVLKIKKLQDQLPAAQRRSIVERIDVAYAALQDATPAAFLTGTDLEIVKDNLTKLKAVAKKAEDKLRAEGRL